MNLDYMKLGMGVERIFKKYAKDTFLSVSEVEKAKRSAGVEFKEVQVLFKDGQAVTLRVKKTGDVYQILVNGRLQPIYNQDDEKKGVEEILAILDKTRDAFQKKQAKQKVKLPAGIKTAAPTMKATLQAKSAQLDNDIQAAKKELGLAA